MSNTKIHESEQPKEKISLAETWQSLLPSLIAVLQNGTDEGKKVVFHQLKEMAEAGDRYLEVATVTDLKPDDNKAEKVAEIAQMLFWDVVSLNYPEVKSGDFGPDETIEFDQACEKALNIWLMWNHPDNQSPDRDEYFKAPSHWKMKEAEDHAKSIGLKTKWYEGDLYIEKKYVEAEFYVGDDDGTPCFTGWYLPMITWNGWQTPVFTKEIAEKVVEDFMKNETGDAKMWWNGENVCYKHSPEDEPTVLEPFTIKVGGIDVTVYDLSLGWVWDKKEFSPL